MPAHQSVSTAEAAFLNAWSLRPLEGIEPVPEYRFHPTRRWRFDFAFPDLKLAIEIQGMGRTAPAFCHKCKKACVCPRCKKMTVVHHAGGHQTPKGMRNDCDKHNAAILMGWRILVFATSDYDPVRWVDITQRAICGVEDLE
jgi:hypothetical protein